MHLNAPKAHLTASNVLQRALQIFQSVDIERKFRQEFDVGGIIQESAGAPVSNKRFERFEMLLSENRRNHVPPVNLRGDHAAIELRDQPREMVCRDKWHVGEGEKHSVFVGECSNASSYRLR